ncbi:LysR family transcriptional regulator [Limnobacter humi]|uniref:LysR family transcriptional regulator n=1 Tax=Limnobacter humi TaxID=1778671 RepID=A0ABT1WJL6_9BURK|nr:LysR family transcriptional regulator [Limnobacter humi]MCQ8897695.1 LysR family transcriptional regulator [Limnobacter humi]
MMDKLHALEVFVAVAETGGFSAAARRCRLSAPVVTKRVAELEQALQVRLFNRTTRFVQLTQAGERYLQAVKPLLEQMRDADEALTGLTSTPQGTLVVTAPALFGRLHVMPVVVDFLKQHPAVQVVSLFQDNVLSLVDEGVDVAIRIGPLPDSRMVATPLGQVRKVLVASPEYFKAHGLPSTPQALEQHSLIAPMQVNPVQEWQFGAGPRATVVRVAPRLVCSTNDSAIEAAQRGLGIARVLSYQVEEAVRLGHLVYCLEEFWPDALPVHALQHEGRRPSAKLRAFLDMAVPAIRQRLGFERG